MNQSPPPSFCSNCGAQLDPGAGFCANCGQPTAQPPVVQPPVQPSNSKRPLIIGISAALVVVIALIIYSVTSLLPNLKPKETTGSSQPAQSVIQTTSTTTQAETAAQTTAIPATPTPSAAPQAGPQSIIQPLGVYLDDLGNSMNGQFYYDASAYIYFADYDASNQAHIYGYDVDAERMDIILDGYGWSFVVFDNWLYFAGNEGPVSDSSDYLYRCRPDGSDLQLLQTGYHYGVSVYNEWLYYCRYDEYNDIYLLCRSNLDGSSEEVIIEDTTANYTIFQDTLYYTNMDFNLCQANPDGSGEAVLIQEVDFFIIGQGRFVYYDWVGDIYHAALDGSDIRLVAEIYGAPPYSINSYGDLIYYTVIYDDMDETGSAYYYELYQTDYDGASSYMVYSGYSFGTYLNIANDRVFVINYAENPETGEMPASVVSMLLDGTDVMFLSR